MVNSINFSDTKNRTEQIRMAATASLIAAASGHLTLKIAVPQIEKRIRGDFAKKFTLTEPEQDLLIKEGQKIIDESKLARFGCKIKLVNEDTVCKNPKIQKSLESVKKASNAFYMTKERTVYINKKFLTPIFHELGHAQDHKKGTLTRLAKIYKLTGNKKIYYGLPLLAIFTSKKKNADGKELSTQDKAFNIIRESAGVIGALGQLPMLIEEKLASKNGYKMAKEANLEEKLLKLIKKTHTTGFNGYLRQVLYYVIVATAAIKAKDYWHDKLPEIKDKYFSKSAK